MGGNKSIKEVVIKINNLSINVAVVNAMSLLEDIKNGNVNINTQKL